MTKLEILNYYTRLEKGEDPEKIVKELKETPFYRMVGFYLNVSKGLINNGNISETEVPILREIIKILQYIYNNSEVYTGVTDPEYDELYDLYIRGGNQNIIGSINPAGKPTREHRYPDLRGTLDKVHFITNKDKNNDAKKSIENFITSISSEYYRVTRNYIKPEHYNALCTIKYDGISGIIECDGEGRVEYILTRGDTEKNTAVDITSNFPPLQFPTIKEFPKGVPFGIKTEIVMTNENYDKICKEIGHFDTPRSAVTSITNTLTGDPELAKYLTIIPLLYQNYNTKEIVTVENLNPYEFIEINLISDFEKVPEIFNTLRELASVKYGIPTDGIVVRLTHPEIQKIMGRKDNINKYEFAYKFPPETKKTILEDVVFQTGALGNITPVAKIVPTKMLGRTIKSVSLGSMDIFRELNLHKNDEVILHYEIIPYMTKDDTCVESDLPLIEVPTHCIHCGEELIGTTFLKCPNMGCPSNVVGRINNYVSKMKIPNISTGIINSLYEHGYLKDIPDLYELHKFKYSIAEIPGYGVKSVERILSGIEYRKECYDYELLGAIGIVGISSKIFQKILDIYNISDIIDICRKRQIEKLISLPGIQTLTANKIMDGIIQNEVLILRLSQCIKIKHNDNSNPIASVVFTGVRDMDFEEFLSRKGVHVNDSFNKKLSYVIADDINSMSGKAVKARKNGIPIITLSDAYEKFSYNK